LIDNGTSIIFVSHNFYLVQAVCNQALYLQHGQVKEFGATKEVIARYEQDLHRERAAKFADATQESTIGQSTISSGLASCGLVSHDDVEIIRVEVANNTNCPAESLPSTEPARIRLHYNAYKALGKVQASVFIMRSDGLTCCMMRTKLDDFELVIAQGAGIITVDLTPLQLISGTYYAEAWLLNASDSMTLNSSAGRSDWFTVQGAALSYEESSGIFEPQTRWDHTTNEIAAMANGSTQSSIGREDERNNGNVTQQEYITTEKVSIEW
jgi:ABC-type glutathione transport system ATPase component